MKELRPLIFSPNYRVHAHPIACTQTVSFLGTPTAPKFERIMETYSSHLHVRDNRLGPTSYPTASAVNLHYFPAASASKSPMDDLLPELWLTSNEATNGTRTSRPAPHHYVGGNYHHSLLESPGVSPGAYSAYHPAEPAPASRSFDHRQPRSLDEYYYQNHCAEEAQSGGASLQSCLLLREQSLEYAQSLLPHSLLPLTEDNLDKNHKLNHYGSDHLNLYSNAGSLGRKNSHHDSVLSRSSSSSSSSKNQKYLNTQLYKTELCASYIKLGACLYGQKCQFAHGKEELKEVDRPSNWRSKPCVNWTQFGSCRYGKRCCFKHES